MSYIFHKCFCYILLERNFIVLSVQHTFTSLMEVWNNNQKIGLGVIMKLWHKCCQHNENCGDPWECKHSASEFYLSWI